MKINALHIDNFGKFQNFNMDFNDTLNVIFGENEYGKTTIMSFIKLMFYAESSKSRNIAKNLRRKYRPINAKSMSGSITFTHEGQDFRLERAFGETPRLDVVNLINLTTGMKGKIHNTVSIGEQFFGLSREAFEKSIFIGQFGNTTVSEKESDEITKRLTSLATDGNENISAQKAIRTLNKAKEVYLSKNGKVGKSDKLRFELENLKTDLILAKRDEDELLKFNKECKKIEDEIKTIQKSIEKYNKYTLLRDKINEVQRIKQNIQVIQKIDALENKIKIRESELGHDGFIIDENFIDDIKKRVNNIYSLNDSLKKAKNHIKTIENEISIIDVDLKENNTNSIIDENAKRLKYISNAEEILKKKEDTYNNTIRQFYEVKTELLLAQSLAEKNNSNKKSVMNNKRTIPTIALLLGIIILIAGVLLGIFLSPLYLLIGFLGLTAVIFSLPKLKISDDEFNTLKKKESSNSTINTFPTQSNDIAVKQAEFNKLNESCNKLKDEIDKINAYLDTQKVKLRDVEKKKHDLDLDFTSLYSKKSDKKDELFRQQKTISEIERSIEKERNDIFLAYNKYEYLNNFEKLEVSLNRAEKKLKNLNDIKAQLKWQNESFDGDRSKIKDDAVKLKSIQDELQKYNTDIDNIPSTVKIQKTIEQETEKINNLKKKLNTMITNNLLKFKNKSGISEIEQQIKVLQEELSEQTTLCQTYDIAIEVLQQTETELRRNFAPKLNRRVKNIFSSLVGKNHYNEVLVSKDFDITVKKEKGQSLNWQYLSNGTVDQVYFSLRVALSQLISENNEPLPLILDDIFLQYDDTRAKKAIEFLNDFSSKTQIILFTCRKSFYDMFKNI